VADVARSSSDDPGVRLLAGAAVFTGRHDRAWDEAVALRGADVVATGSLADLRVRWPDATEEDLGGSTVLPGLIDAHNHFLSTGESLAALDLRYPGVDSAAALLRIVAEAVARTPTGEPISGFGFDHGKYALPSLAELDAACAGHPMILFHTSGHHVLVNGVVLREAGVGDGTADPPGGRFVRDGNGHATGLCLDTACGVVVPTDVDIGSHGPNFHVRAPLSTLVAAVERASMAFASAGLTCVCDAQVTSREMAAYRAARREGRLPLRTVCMPLSSQLDSYEAAGLAGPFGDDRLSVGHLKVYADGTLTGGTAAFGDDVAVDQDASFFHEPADLVALIERAWIGGWRVGVHAQGDRAIELVLDGFEAGASAAPNRDARPRIEHAGYPGDRGLERMRRLDVIAVQQPSYLFDYGDQYLETLGPLAHALQPWRSELRAGIRVVLSSDSDVSTYRPLATIANAMRRRTRDGVVLGEDERLTLDEALFAHTVDAAFAVGLEHRIGSLEAGKAADLVVVAGDLRALEPDAIERAEVLKTVVDGEPIFDLASHR
jgi:predicted amidohydrolase YtcJ